jgi:hypothetical protein
MFKPSTPLSVIGSLTFASIAALLGTAGHLAYAQAQTPYAAPPYYQNAPFPMDGSVVVNGEIAGRDSDQQIRSNLLRAHRNWDTGGN